MCLGGDDDVSGGLWGASGDGWFGVVLMDVIPSARSMDSEVDESLTS